MIPSSWSAAAGAALRAAMLLFLLLPGASGVPAAAAGEGDAWPAPDWIARDAAGVLRYPDGTEVRLWGVNYLVPFATDFANLQREGIDHQAAVREDLDDLVKMGANLVRVRVVDRQISDADGALLENTHLDVLDYLVAECGRRNITVLLTAISWIPAGEESTSGFSDGHFRNDLVNRQELWPPQERYLRELATHRNPHSGRTYAEDPVVGLWEVFDDPVAEGYTDDRVPLYRRQAHGRRMIEVLREAGVRQPVLLSAARLEWDSPEPEALFRETGADGWTFDIHVARNEGAPLQRSYIGGPRFWAWVLYEPPRFAWGEGFAGVVTEFDFAGSTQGSWMPVVARSLIAGGVQVAAAFQYDPAAVAAFNAAFRNHFLNYRATPAKALGFAAGARVFRTVPLGAPLEEQVARPWVFDGCLVDSDPDRVRWRSTDGAELLYAGPLDGEFEGRTLEDFRAVAGADSSALVGTGGPGVFRVRVDPGDGRIDLELGPRVLPRTDNPFETGKEDLNVWFCRRVVDLDDDPHRVSLALRDRSVAVYRAGAEGTLEKLPVTGPVFDAAPGRYVVYLDETR